MPRKRIANLADSKRQAILAAAMGEFVHHSFETASLNEIIRASGLSKGVIYYHFASKEDLFLTLLQESMGTLGDVIKVEMVDPKGQTEGYWPRVTLWLTCLGNALVTAPLQALFLQRVIAAGARGEIAFAKPMLWEIEEWLHDRLVEGQIAGAVRRDLPLELLTRLVWGAVRMILDWFVADDTKTQRSCDAERCATATADILRRLCIPHDATSLWVAPNYCQDKYNESVGVLRP